MTAVKRFFGEHRIFCGLFAFLTAYEIVIGNSLAAWQAPEDFLTFYAVDFSLGFCSRFLPGAVYRLLFKTADLKTVSVIGTALLVLFFAVLCVLLEKLIRSCGPQNRPLCFVFVFLFLTGPAAFSLFVQSLGVIDVYWIFLCLVFIVALSSRRLYFLIPPVFILAVLVHYGALICYIPMMGVLLLYRIAWAEDKKEKRALWTVLLLSMAAAVLLTGYFIVYERRNLVYSMEEFNAILRSRGASYTYYYDYNVYRYMNEAGDFSAEAYIFRDAGMLGTLLRSVWMQIKMTVALRIRAGVTREYVMGFLVMLPAAFAAIRVLIARFRQAKDAGFLRRAVYLLQPLLFFAALTVSLLFSSDTFRWLTHAFLPLMTVFLYLAYREGDDFWQTALARLSAVPPPVTALYLLLYAAVIPIK